MSKFKGKFRIESNRWEYWDYSSKGFYFITIITQNRARVLCEIKKGNVVLLPCGEIVKNEILHLEDYHPCVVLNEWVVMPDHIHLLIELTDNNDDAYADNAADDNNNGINNDNDDDDTDGTDDDDTVKKIHKFSLPSPPQPPHPQQPPSQWWYNKNHQPTINEIKQYRKKRRIMIIPKILGKLKMLTSKDINILNNTAGHKNWQANYHDHVVRNDDECIRIKNYIINNPENWDKDKC